MARKERNLRVLPSGSFWRNSTTVCFISAAALIGGCPVTPPGASRVFRADTTLEELIIAAGELNVVQNDAVVTVTGNATIDGTLQTGDGRITLLVEGDLLINGTLRATAPAPNDTHADDPFDRQPSGILIVVGAGSITFGESAAVISTGPVVITDDASVLDETPEDLYDEVENVLGEEIPTLAPLPPSNAAFAGDGSKMAAHKIAPLQQGGESGPVTISGTWPPAGSAPVPGDEPVLIFRFTGSRPLVLDDWTVNGPAAPAGAGEDQGADPGEDAGGGRGRNGMRLNIRNEGGPINIVNDVVLNLANGGNGGSASAVCADATGGAGGLSGNLRMSASAGIDISGGRLTINPGRGGDGGDATVEIGTPGADGCPGGDGDDAMATGGSGADNEKRLFVRGNVAGLENVSFGPLAAGSGGDAIAEACDAGDGDPCCNGGDGGDAAAEGGSGGNAALNVSGFPVTAGLVTGGRGGNADATGGFGGDGGDCKFDDAGDGGDGGSAAATGGNGGTATNSAAGGAEGGDGGDATAVGGDAGRGGDSGFGIPGLGGFGGTANAMSGNGGAATIPGTDGNETDDDGDNGDDGEELPAEIYCLRLTDFIDLIGATILPGQYEGPVTRLGSSTQIGEIDIEFVAGAGAEYQSSAQPVPHVGIGNGTLSIDLTSLVLVTPPPGTIGGIRLEPLFAEGIDGASPLGIRALNATGGVLDAVSLAQLPNNSGNPNEPEAIDVLFETETAIAAIEIVVPRDAFVTLIRVYLLDP